MTNMHTSRKILAGNLKALIAHDALSVNAWAIKHGLPQKVVDRIIKEENGASVDTLDKIAESLGLMAWQLLIIDMDVKNTPRLAVSEAEIKLVSRLKTLLTQQN